MKNKILIFLMVICIFSNLVAAIPVRASVLTMGDYKYIISNGGATITNYNGLPTNETLNIPDMLGGYPVTSIGNEAMMFSEHINIILPNSISEIGDYAFGECINLESIVIPDSVTSIGDYAFAGCTSLTDILLPESVTNIGEGAFCHCDNLLSIVIPDNIMDISNSMFLYCNNLMSITISNNIVSIGESAFGHCTNLTNVDIPDTVTTIERSAFEGCSSLENIDIPNSVTSIGDYAFAGCTYLTDVLIPDSITNIGDYLFYRCESLTNINLPDNIKSIGNYAFWECINLKSIVIPDSVTSIGDSVFYDCKRLTNITLSNSINNIGDYVFKNCSALENIIIPDSVMSIGECAFIDCSSLEVVTIPDRVSSIGWGAFQNCSNIISIVLPDTLTRINNSTFYGCKNLTNVYYGGTEDRWLEIDIEDNNENLTNATIHYNYADNTVSQGPTTKTYLNITLPKDNATELSPVQDLKMYFNSSIALGKGKVYVKEYKTDKTVKTLDISECTKLGDNSVAFMDITLDAGKTYYVTMDGGAIISRIDNRPFYGIQDKEFWNFSISKDKALQKTTYVGLEYAKEGNLWWKTDNIDLPPIPKGSDDDYMWELNSWAEQYGVESVDSHSFNPDTLNMPVKIPVTDVNGQTFLLDDGGTTVKQVMQDLIFIEHLKPYIDELDKKLTEVDEDFSKLVDYNSEAELYCLAESYAARIQKYINSRNGKGKSSLFLSVAAPLAYIALVDTSVNERGDQESRFIRTIADATVESCALQGQISSVTGTADYETYKQGVSDIKNYIKIGKELYKIKTNGISSSTVELGADLLSLYFEDRGIGYQNETLSMISSAFSELSDAKSAVQMCMFLGNSLGFFPYVVDLYANGNKKLADETKAWYFIADYYLEDKYPGILEGVYDEGFVLDKTYDRFNPNTRITENYYNEIQNDIVLRKWARILDERGLISNNTDNIINTRRDMVNAVNLFKFAKTVNTDEVKESLLNYMSAEFNRGKTTEVYGKCPIKINVFDKENNLLATLSSEEQTETETEYGTFYLMGESNEVKHFILASGEYKMEIVPYNDGEMTVTVVQRDADGNITETSYYEDVNILKDEVYTADLSLEKPILIKNEQVLTESTAFAERIDISAPTNEIACGSTMQLLANIYPDYAADKSVLWSVGDERIATIDQNGCLKGISNGIVTVSACVNASDDPTIVDNVISTSLEFSVYTPVSEITDAIENVAMLIGEQCMLTPILADVSAERPLSWSSSDSNVAWVDSNGNITAQSEGNTIITAESDGVKKDYYITVSESPLAISMSQSDVDGDKVIVKIQNMSCLQNFESNVYIAVYCENRLISLKNLKLTLEKQEDVTEYVKLDLDGKTYKAKAFVWSDNLVPLQKAEILSII